MQCRARTGSAMLDCKPRRLSGCNGHYLSKKTKGVGSLFLTASQRPKSLINHFAVRGGPARRSPSNLPAPSPFIAPHTAIDPAHVTTCSSSSTEG